MFRLLASPTFRLGLRTSIRHEATCSSPRVAVVLSGCGVNDGSEIHEAASVLSHLTRNDVIPHCFAPDRKQADVVNHLDGKVDESHCRSALVESARIARGKVEPLCNLITNMTVFSAVVFPGGFGVAKNLSDYACKGPDCSVIPEVDKVIKGFYKSRKPIALCCIAPILAAKVLCNITITLGKDSPEKWPYRAAIHHARQMGAIVEDRDWNEISFDSENLIFSTPAFMYDGQYHQIDDGIGHMINYMILALKKGAIPPPVDCPC